MNDSEFRWTAASLRAMLEGDTENALIAGTPGGIKAQEKAGQQMLVNSHLLPRRMEPDRAAYESLGIVFGEMTDELFIPCVLPAGWTREASDHDMWSHVLDERGRKRIGVFYKAAFYDRRADMHLIRRFVHAGDYDQPNSYRAVVKDCDAVIWASAWIDEPKSREEYKAYSERQDALDKEAQAWLEERYPDWRNPLAYWED